MKIRLVSDLHLDLNPRFELPIMEDESEQTLVIPGDLCSIANRHIWIKAIDEFCKRFKHVIWVAGNHEYYNGVYNPEKYDNEVLESVESENLVAAFENKIVSIDGVNFVLSTLWTNYNNRNAIDMINAKQCLNDFRCIKIENDGVTLRAEPGDFVTAFEENLEFLKSYKSFVDTDFPTVFVTHHAPSNQSTHPMYLGSKLNPCFYSEIIHMFDDVDYWFHGHMHNAISYTSYHNDHTKVILNPVGYTRENSGFDSKLVIHIGD